MLQHLTTPSSFDRQTDESSVDNGQGFSTFVFGMDSLYLTELTVNLIMTPLLSTFGIVANIANIIVFVKMGFLEAINIMFLALSVADLVLVINFVVGAVALNAAFERVNVVFFDLRDLLLIINPFTWAFVGFGSCTTALITIERSICIILPLKVKTIFTPRRTALALLVLFVLPLATLIQKYVVMELEWVTSPTTNQTRLVHINRENILFVGFMAALAYSTIPSLLSFVLVAIGTTLMVVKLNQSARWRQTSAQSSQGKSVSAKEIKVVRSVVLVCGVFIVCFTPNALMSLASIAYPQFHISNSYFGIFVYIMFSVTHFFQAISSSLNICIYLTTSTKYKEIFVQSFLSCKRKHKNAL